MSWNIPFPNSRGESVCSWNRPFLKGRGLVSISDDISVTSYTRMESSEERTEKVGGETRCLWPDEWRESCWFILTHTHTDKSGGQFHTCSVSVCVTSIYPSGCDELMNLFSLQIHTHTELYFCIKVHLCFCTVMWRGGSWVNVPSRDVIVRSPSTWQLHNVCIFSAKCKASADWLAGRRVWLCKQNHCGMLWHFSPAV